MASDALGRRIVAALIDTAVCFVLLLLVAGLFGDAAAGDTSISAEVRGWPAVLFFLLVFGYFTETERRWGQTIGKRVLRLRVVDAAGAPPSTRAALIRNALRLVDWLPFLYVVGFISMLATGRRRLRLGDLAAGTQVVGPGAGSPDEPTSAPPPDDDDVLAQVLR